MKLYHFSLKSYICKPVDKMLKGKKSDLQIFFSSSGKLEASLA